MRFLMFALAWLAVAGNASAQEQTLFKNAESSGSFGGPVVAYTIISDQGALMVGGRGGWVINHSFVIGGAGFGVATKVNARSGALPGQGPLDVEFGYGGVTLEYLFLPQRLHHFGVSTLIGGGSTNYVKDVGSGSKGTEHVGESDGVFVVEPGVNGELNVTHWLRLNAGLSYRFVNGIHQDVLRNGDFSGPSVSLAVKFGKF